MGWWDTCPGQPPSSAALLLHSSLPYLPHTVWVVEQPSVRSLAPEAPSKKTESRWSGSQGTKQAPAGEWAQWTP